MQVVNPVTATILHLFNNAGTLCMGIMSLHRPEIKFYSFYASIFLIVMSALRLLDSRSVYRKALAKKNETPQSSTETTGTEGALENEKLQGVSKTADLLV